MDAYVTRGAPSSSAAASTSADGAARSTYRPTSAVEMALRRARQTPSNDVWSDVTAVVTDWLLSLKPKGETRTTRQIAQVRRRSEPRTEPWPFVHWFCGADSAKPVWDAAVFSIRLLGYKPAADILLWRETYDIIMEQCPACIREYQIAKARLDDRYLSLYKTSSEIARFNEGVRNLEAQRISRGCTSDSSSVRELAVYSCVANALLVDRGDIRDILRRHALGKIDLSKHKLVPGLLALAISNNADLARWALEQIRGTQKVDADEHQRFGLAAYVDKLLDDIAQQDLRQTPTSRDPIAVWKTLDAFVARLDGKAVRASPRLARAFAGHLGDEGRHFWSVLRGFTRVLSELGEEIWLGSAIGGETGRDEVILANVIDNRAFQTGFGESDKMRDFSATFIRLFLASEQHSAGAFTRSLQTILQLLLGRFQAAHVDDNARASAVLTAIGLLASIFVADSSEDHLRGSAKWRHASEALSALDMHLNVIVRTAFASPEVSPALEHVRQEAAAFCGQLAKSESFRLLAGYTRLSQVERKASEEVAVYRPTTALWRMLESTGDKLTRNDINCVVTVLNGAAISSHFEAIKGGIWRNLGSSRAAASAVNSSITAMHSCLHALLFGMLDNGLADSPGLLDHPNTVEALLVFAFSPHDALQAAATNVIKAVFDVDSRRDCFWALLSRYPARSLRGIVVALKLFAKLSEILPDVCNVAKRAVRCLADVLDVLTSTRDGLLRLPQGWHQDTGSLTLAGFWKLLCAVEAEIFRKTPQWATFHDNEEMVEWMRDAIVFGTEAVEQVRTFQAAIKRQGIADVARAQRSIVDALNDPLASLVSWLRLNDVDLLSRAFQLLLGVLALFARSGVAVRQETFDRLKRVVTKSSEKSSRSYLLRSEQLAALVDSLVSHDQSGEIKKLARGSRSGQTVVEIEDSSDDEVQAVVSRPQHSKGASPPAAPATSTKSTSRTNFGVATMKNAKPPRSQARPRGVPWTTYSSAQPQHRLSSSSSESEDEGRPTGLAALAQATKQVPKLQQGPSNQRRIKLLDEGGGPSTSDRVGAISRQSRQEQHSENAARLRLVQDFGDLHKRILKWDVTTDASPRDIQQVRPLSREFKTASEYTLAFQGLLLLECWAQMRSAYEETVKKAPPATFVLASRASVDDFIDCDGSIAFADMAERQFFSDSDVVVLSNGVVRTVAKVQAAQRKRDSIELTVRVCVPASGDAVSYALVPRSKWELVKFYSLTTIQREYSALQGIGYLGLVGDVLQPRASRGKNASPQELEEASRVYRVNAPQAAAIVASTTVKRGFCLIQGPPGTGKTRTILGLVGAILGQGDETRRSKILICAPSNAAIDEVARRIKEGIYGSDGRPLTPKVVRIGADAAVDVSVKDIFIDELVDRELGGAAMEDGDETQLRVDTLRVELDSLRALRREKQAELEGLEQNSARKSQLADEVKATRSRIFTLSQQLDAEKDKAVQRRRARDAQFRNTRVKIISEADVVCSTLAGSGHDIMNQVPVSFGTVIIDEAAQSVELSSLIPLRYGCQRCVLVGDPLQLPPTIMSREATRLGYDRSLFVRLMERLGQSSVHLLSLQYRMHPDISRFPSTTFYQSQLCDGDGMALSTAQAWHKSSLFPPYAFFHVRDGKERANSHSYVNDIEVATAIALYERLVREFPMARNMLIGVLSPYKSQVALLRDQFRRRVPESALANIAFNTVDGFQGQEKDVIILSCVRGGAADKTVGFLADTRRMNVALTRARSSLFILGDSNKLRTNEHWCKLVEDARARSLITEVDVDYFRSAPSIPRIKPLRQTSPLKRSPEKRAITQEVQGSPQPSPLRRRLAQSLSDEHAAEAEPQRDARNIAASTFTSEGKVFNGGEASSEARASRENENVEKETTPLSAQPSSAPVRKVAPAKRPPPNLFISKRPAHRPKKT